MQRTLVPRDFDAQCQQHAAAGLLNITISGVGQLAITFNEL
ncbi:MAG: hypothetical protein AAGA95_14305 [Pseudomonadota bacterium]